MTRQQPQYIYYVFWNHSGLRVIIGGLLCMSLVLVYRCNRSRRHTYDQNWMVA